MVQSKPGHDPEQFVRGMNLEAISRIEAAVTAMGQDLKQHVQESSAAHTRLALLEQRLDGMVDPKDVAVMQSRIAMLSKIMWVVGSAAVVATASAIFQRL